MAFFVAWAVCWSPAAVTCALALDWRPSRALTAEQKLSLLASLYLIAPLVLWGVNWLTGASFSDYGLSWNSSILTVGAGIGGGVIGMIVLFGCQTALGWITWQPVIWQRLGLVLLTTLPLALWIGGTEELVFRGFILTQLQQDYQIWLAAAISSLIFALLHLVWEQRETLPQLPGLWLLAMVLVLARYIDSGSLGLAWGLHAGWIWAIASLDSAKIISYTGKASEWITGKAGKPLAGIVGILCLLATGAILWLSSPLVHSL